MELKSHNACWAIPRREAPRTLAALVTLLVCLPSAGAGPFTPGGLAAGAAFGGVAFAPTAVPEPVTLLLGGLAVAGFAAVAIRRLRNRLGRRVTE
jgi:hypothetical protein